MERPFVGESITATVPFLRDDGTPLSNPTGVVFVVRHLHTDARHVVPGVATDDPHIFEAILPVTAPGTWEAQARCSGPIVIYTPRIKFQAIEALDFTPD